MKKPGKAGIIVLIAAGLVILAAAVYLLVRSGYAEKAIDLINKDLSSPLFIVLTAILPAIGFPISVFLVVAGVKFGIGLGILLWLCILPVHTTIGYLAASYLRPPLVSFLDKRLGYSVPEIPEDKQATYSFLFLAVPGIPYAAKNYLLPLAGVAFRYCVIMNCIVQSVLGLPFIILGKSGEEMNPTMFSVALFSLALLFVLLRWLKNKYSPNQK